MDNELPEESEVVPMVVLMIVVLVIVLVVEDEVIEMVMQVVVEGPVMRTLYKEVTRKALIGVVEDTEVDKEVDE